MVFLATSVSHLANQVLPASALPAKDLKPPWPKHAYLSALRSSLQITADCWNLLISPDGSSRKQEYLPQGEREPQSAYDRRMAAARPSGFFRDALRTYAGMLSHGSWLSLPAQLVPRANAMNWELLSSHGLPSSIDWREPVPRPTGSVTAGSETAVRDQIAALLGDDDAPDR